MRGGNRICHGNRSGSPANDGDGHRDRYKRNDHSSVGRDRSASATWQLKEFKVYLPGDATGTPGEYLGQDAFTGWHFVRASEAIRAKSDAGDGVCAQRNTRRAGAGRFRVGHRTAREGRGFRAVHHAESSRADSVACRSAPASRSRKSRRPGLPVFDRDGALVGLAGLVGWSKFLQIARARARHAVMLINVEESSAFISRRKCCRISDAFRKTFPAGRWRGSAPTGSSRWIAKSAKFLNLTAQSGAVVSEVLEGSPAEKAGLKARDIILALEGKPLPQLKPDRVIVSYIEREIERRAARRAFARSRCCAAPSGWNSRRCWVRSRN